MSGQKRRSLNKGFSLLEVMIVLLIMALLGTFVVPNLQGSKPAAERKQFVAQLNEFMAFAWYNGVTTGKVQKIVFDLEKNSIRLEQQKMKEEKPSQETVYELVTRAYTQTELEWPKQYQVKNFFIEGSDEVARYGSGRTLKSAYFFLVPDGLTQDVVINAIDMNDRTGTRKGKQFSLVLNPFTAHFKEYDSFQQVK